MSDSAASHAKLAEGREPSGVSLRFVAEGREPSGVDSVVIAEDFVSLNCSRRAAKFWRADAAIIAIAVMVPIPTTRRPSAN